MTMIWYQCPYYYIIHIHSLTSAQRNKTQVAFKCWHLINQFGGKSLVHKQNSPWTIITSLTYCSRYSLFLEIEYRSITKGLCVPLSVYLVCVSGKHSSTWYYSKKMSDETQNIHWSNRSHIKMHQKQRCEAIEDYYAGIGY